MHQSTSATATQNQGSRLYPATRPESPEYIFAMDAVHLERASHPKRRKAKLPEIPPGYSASFTLHPDAYIHTATRDGAKLGHRRVNTLPAGVLTLCPIIHKRARHRVGYTVGREGDHAEGILCPMCKHIYYFMSMAPVNNPRFSNIGEYYEDIRKELGL